MERILFLAQGSLTACAAAQMVIKIAQRTGAEVLAEFVVDRARIRDIEEFDGRPGLCGSGVFVEAEQSIIRSLSELGESTLVAFAALAQGVGVRVSQSVDVGASLDILVSRAADCDVLVLPGTEANVVVAREVAENSQRPVILVSQDIYLLAPDGADPRIMSELISELEEINPRVWVSKQVEHGLYENVPPQDVVQSSAALD
jgi:nucleotide-binding universal stress UspA family protein